MSSNRTPEARRNVYKVVPIAVMATLVAVAGLGWLLLGSEEVSAAQAPTLHIDHTVVDWGKKLAEPNPSDS